MVQELRKNKRKVQKSEEVNPFSGMVYCADCGTKMYLCRARTLAYDQEHLKYATYSANKDECSSHFIRTVVVKEIVLAEINKVLERVHCDEEKFIKSATKLSSTQQSSELKKAKKSADTTQFIKVAKQYERITELTPEIMHELIEKIVVHAPDKSSGHREQKVEIHF